MSPGSRLAPQGPAVRSRSETAGCGLAVLMNCCFGLGATNSHGGAGRAATSKRQLGGDPASERRADPGLNSNFDGDTTGNPKTNALRDNAHDGAAGVSSRQENQAASAEATPTEANPHPSTMPSPSATLPHVQQSNEVPQPLPGVSLPRRQNSVTASVPGTAAGSSRFVAGMSAVVTRSQLALLLQVPSILTLFDSQGNIVLQSAAAEAELQRCSAVGSNRAKQKLASVAAATLSPESALWDVFSVSPQLLDQLLCAVNQGDLWRGTVPVPLNNAVSAVTASTATTNNTNTWDPSSGPTVSAAPGPSGFMSGPRNRESWRREQRTGMRTTAASHHGPCGQQLLLASKGGQLGEHADSATSEMAVNKGPSGVDAVVAKGALASMQQLHAPRGGIDDLPCVPPTVATTSAADNSKDLESGTGAPSSGTSPTGSAVRIPRLASMLRAASFFRRQSKLAAKPAAGSSDNADDAAVAGGPAAAALQSAANAAEDVTDSTSCVPDRSISVGGLEGGAETTVCGGGGGGNSSAAAMQHHHLATMGHLLSSDANTDTHTGTATADTSSDIKDTSFAADASQTLYRSGNSVTPETAGHGVPAGGSVDASAAGRLGHSTGEDLVTSSSSPIRPLDSPSRNRRASKAPKKRATGIIKSSGHADWLDMLGQLYGSSVTTASRISSTPDMAGDMGGSGPQQQQLQRQHAATIAGYVPSSERAYAGGGTLSPSQTVVEPASADEVGATGTTDSLLPVASVGIVLPQPGSADLLSSSAVSDVHILKHIPTSSQHLRLSSTAAAAGPSLGGGGGGGGGAAAAAAVAADELGSVAELAAMWITQPTAAASTSDAVVDEEWHSVVQLPAPGASPTSPTSPDRNLNPPARTSSAPVVDKAARVVAQGIKSTDQADANDQHMCEAQLCASPTSPHTQQQMMPGQMPVLATTSRVHAFLVTARRKSVMGSTNATTIAPRRLASRSGRCSMDPFGSSPVNSPVNSSAINIPRREVSREPSMLTAAGDRSGASSGDTMQLARSLKPSELHHDGVNRDTSSLTAVRNISGTGGMPRQQSQQQQAPDYLTSCHEESSPTSQRKAGTYVLSLPRRCASSKVVVAQPSPQRGTDAPSQPTLPRRQASELELPRPCSASSSHIHYHSLLRQRLSRRSFSEAAMSPALFTDASVDGSNHSAGTCGDVSNAALIARLSGATMCTVTGAANFCSDIQSAYAAASHPSSASQLSRAAVGDMGLISLMNSEDGQSMMASSSSGHAASSATAARLQALSGLSRRASLLRALSPRSRRSSSNHGSVFATDGPTSGQTLMASRNESELVPLTMRQSSCGKSCGGLSTIMDSRLDYNVDASMSTSNETGERNDGSRSRSGGHRNSTSSGDQDAVQGVGTHAADYSSSISPCDNTAAEELDLAELSQQQLMHDTHRVAPRLGSRAAGNSTYECRSPSDINSLSRTAPGAPHHTPSASLLSVSWPAAAGLGANTAAPREGSNSDFEAAAYPSQQRSYKEQSEGTRVKGRDVSSASGLETAVGEGMCVSGHAVSELSPMLLPSQHSQHDEMSVMLGAESAVYKGGRAELDVAWHEITAKPVRCAETGQQYFILMQHDVTARVELERRLAAMLEAEHQLLENIFPRHVLEHVALEPWAAGSAMAVADSQGTAPAMPPLLREPHKLATAHEEITILFADVVGFTPMCRDVEPETVMAFLNDLFSRFDDLLAAHSVYKVETIGDCYMVAGGLMRRDEAGVAEVCAQRDPLHAHHVVDFAKAMLAAAQHVLLPGSAEPVKLRVGIHSGPATSGVVGSRMPRFCLFGSTVNTASRMESTAVPGTVHVSAVTRDLAPGEEWIEMETIQVKGLGDMRTYMLDPLGACPS